MKTDRVILIRGNHEDLFRELITADGMENASHRYTSGEVKKMIEWRKEKYGWEFLFLGANIDAVQTAKHFAIGADRTVNFHNDTMGIALNYDVVSETVAEFRGGAPLAANWKVRIDEDFRKRKQ